MNRIGAFGIGHFRARIGIVIVDNLPFVE